MSDFQSKTIWITGASSGIGRELALELAKTGAKLILSARREDELNQVKAQTDNPENIAVLPLDLENNHYAESWVTEAWSCFKGIDILINNGGIGQFGSVRQTKESVERKLFEINYFGTVALTKQILPLFLKQGHGHIVTVGSIAGKFGQANLAAYSASKAALILYFESLKEELVGSGIKIQVVSPGFINTSVTLNSLNPEGLPLNKNSKAQENGMSTETFAKKFIKNLKGNNFHAYIGGKELLAVPLHGIMPKLFYRLLRK